MTRVDGTPYEVQLGDSGWTVMLRTARAAIAGGAPIVLEVAGPYPTLELARDAAIALAVTRARLDLGGAQ